MDRAAKPASAPPQRGPLSGTPRVLDVVLDMVLQGARCGYGSGEDTFIWVCASNARVPSTAAERTDVENRPHGNLCARWDRRWKAAKSGQIIGDSLGFYGAARKRPSDEAGKVRSAHGAREWRRSAAGRMGTSGCSILERGTLAAVHYMLRRPRGLVPGMEEISFPMNGLSSPRPAPASTSQTSSTEVLTGSLPICARECQELSHAWAHWMCSVTEIRAGTLATCRTARRRGQADLSAMCTGRGQTRAYVEDALPV